MLFLRYYVLFCSLPPKVPKSGWFQFHFLQSKTKRPTCFQLLLQFHFRQKLPTLFQGSSSQTPPPLSRFGIETISFDLRTQCLAFVKYILMQSCHGIGLEICNSVLSSETLIHQFCFALKLGSSSQGTPCKVSLLSMDRSRRHFSKQLYFSKLLWETIFYLRTPL